VIVLAVALAIGSRAGRAGTGPDARAARIESEIRCPECRGVSVADSATKSAAAIRKDVADQVRAGRSDAVIEQSIAAHYGADILLRPPATGIAVLVWALPIAAAVVAVAALAMAFRRWHATTEVLASAEDRERVARELAP
jgi:cytochrome c-type biogenesis protein CcmH